MPGTRIQSWAGALSCALMSLSLLPACALGPLEPAEVPVDKARAAPLELNVSPAAASTTVSDVADLVDLVGPAVVNITTITAVGDEHPLGFLIPEGGHPRERTGAGSGFLLDAGGHVVTNAHVVEDADEVRVRLRDEREFTATIIGRDSKLDLALLKIDDKDALPNVHLGDSESLRVGEAVVAVGNPFGLGHSVTLGIVSAKARSIGAGPYDDFIQTDASINPGNSGGPLFNLRGEVIGINTAIRAGADGIGFAIPINVLKDVVGQLKDKGFVERGKLGLAFQPVTAEIARALDLPAASGALVSEITPGGAASKAGLRDGDVIVAVDDVAIRHAEDLPRQVARHKPSSTVKLKLFRAGQPKVVEVKLDRLENNDAVKPRPKRNKKAAPKSLGLELDSAPSGVRVVKVATTLREISVGDIILEVDGVSVKDAKELEKAVEQAQERGSTLLKVRRGSRQRYVGVTLD
jgi:serine protease Do